MADQKSCAFFDIDGTLLRGFIIQAFPQFLADKEFIDSKYSEQINEIIANYVAGKITYREGAEVVPTLYASALIGKNIDDVKRYSKEFMEMYLSEQVFPYAKQLVSEIGNLVDITIALTGSPDDVVAYLKPLGFDKIYGSIIEKNEGIYTGKVVSNIILGEEKAKYAQEISKDLGLDLSSSIALGDSDQDAPILSLVGLPIAINPNNKLREICEMKGWKWLTTEDLHDLECITGWINEKRKN